jgi:twinkle protein
MRTEDFLTRLDDVRKTGDLDWKALCPAHPDHDPSLSITEASDGRILLTCRSSGCSAAEIVEAMGLTLADLFPDKGMRERNWKFRDQAKKSYRLPAPPIPYLTDDAAAWFLKRGISPAVAADWGVTGDKGVVHFPYERNGKLVNVKHRAITGAKKNWMEDGCELVFWGLDRCSGSAQICVVEGEPDALALATAGIDRVMSVPNGGTPGKMDYVASAESIFSACHAVILAGDNDDVGRSCQDELARRIGKEKCYRASWPDGCKDANDTLIEHGPEVVRKCIAEAVPVPIDGIASPTSMVGDTVHRHRTGRQKGAPTGWRSLDNLITFRPGQVTIISGEPGSGKSEFLDCMTLALAKQDDPWFTGVFSPENYPIDQHLAKYAEKWVGKPFYDGPTTRMTESELIDFHKWADGYLAFVNPAEVRGLDDLLAAAKAMVIRYGMRGLVLDPWNQIEHLRPAGMTETDYIGASLSRIQWFARTSDVHVWIVVHPRIMRRNADGTMPIVTPHDLAGSANWFNKSDNIIVVHRDKNDSTKPVEIHVKKVRFRELGRLGVAYLAFDAITGSYRDTGVWEV